MLAKRPDAPKCVVAARPELETGAAARLLREWAGAARNVVVLTARPGAPLGAARRASVAAQLEAGTATLTVTRCLRAPLAGAALAAHLAARDEARRAAAEAADRRAKADEVSCMARAEKIRGQSHWIEVNEKVLRWLFLRCRIVFLFFLKKNCSKGRSWCTRHSARDSERACAH